MTIPDKILDLDWVKINIFLYIKKKCGKSGECEMSMSEIANEFSLKRPTVSRYLQELIQNGFLYHCGHQTDTKRTLISLKPSASNEVCGHQTDTKRTPNERKQVFVEQLKPYLNKYGSTMLNEFYSYWTEMSPGGKKMRFEKETVFDVARRLTTWRNNNYGKHNNSATDLAAKAARILNYTGDTQE